jgi:hypothetical protein
MWMHMHKLKIIAKKKKKRVVGAHLGTIKKLVCFFVRVVNFGCMGKIWNWHETTFQWERRQNLHGQ